MTTNDLHKIQVKTVEYILGAMLVACTLLVPISLESDLMMIKKPMMAGGILALSYLNWREGKLSLAQDRFSRIFLLFVGWNMLSALWADHLSLVWQHSFYWLLLFLLYTNLRTISIRTYSLSFWKWVIGGIVIANLVSLCLFYMKHIYAAGNWNLDLIYSEGLRSTFAYHKNAICSLLIMSSIFILWWSHVASNKWILCLLIPQLIFGLLPGNRLVIVIVVVLGLYYLFLYGKTSWKKRGNILTLGLLGCLAVLVLLYALNASRFTYLYDPMRSFDIGGRDIRLELWRNTWLLCQDYSLLGVGSGNWITHFMKYSGENLLIMQYAPNAHHLPLESAASLGILGFVLIMLLLFLPLKHILQLARQKDEKHFLGLIILCYLIMAPLFAVVYNWNWHFTPAQWLWIAALGLMHHPSPIPTFQTSSRLLSLLTLAAVAFQFFILKTEIHAHRYEQFVKKGEHARAFAELGAMHVPNLCDFANRKSILHLKGLSLWRLKQKEEAIHMLEQAAEQTPFDHRNWYHLGEKYRLRGRHQEAVAAYLHCLAIYPSHVEASLGLCRAASETQDWKAFDQGIAVFYSYFLPRKEKYYDSEAWQTEDPAWHRYWDKACNQQAEFEYLIGKVGDLKSK